jgi:membrane protein YqaA with SNARE-associated domain
MIDFESLGLLGLFVSGFISATLFPLSSEAVFVVLLLKGFNPFICLVVVTLGNGLGGSLTYWMGYKGRDFFNKKRENNRFQSLISKYGSYLGLFSWLPIIGDPLVLALGFYKTPAFQTNMFIWIGKTLRYLFLLYFLI